MSGYDYSITLIIPDALRDDANRFFCALGDDLAPLPGRTFSIPLAATKDGEPTHWLCRFNARPSWLKSWKEWQADGIKEPPAGGEWDDYELTKAKVAAVMAGVEIDTRTFKESMAIDERITRLDPGSEALHWKAVAQAKSLTVGA